MHPEISVKATKNTFPRTRSNNHTVSVNSLSLFPKAKMHFY